MSLTADIAAVRTDARLTPEAKSAAICDLRADAFAALHTREPQTVEWVSGKNNFDVTIKSIARVPRGVSIDLEVVRNGKAVVFNGPWVVINPPMLVPDEKGDIVVPVLRRDPKTREVVQVGEQRFRESADAALNQILRDMIEGLK